MNEIERYIALANLKRLINGPDEDELAEMWHIIRSLAVLDWTLRRPEHGLNAEEKFETIMRKVQQLALAIQEKQGYPAEQKPN